MTTHLDNVRQYGGKVSLAGAVAAVSTMAVLSFCGHFYGLWWRLAYFANPRPQFVIFSLILGLGFLWRRHLSLTIFAGVVLVSNLFVLGPLFLPASQGGPVTGSFTVAHINSDRGNASLDEAVVSGPDVLFVQEVNARAEAEIALLSKYTVVEVFSSEDTHGSALLVSDSAEVEVIGTDTLVTAERGGRKMLVAFLRLGDRTIAVLSAHTTRPSTGDRNDVQLEEFEVMSTWSMDMIAEGNDVVIVGDLNATPWSPRVKKFLDDGRLIQSVDGGGVQGTWPSSLPFFFRIPIDGAAHSDELDLWDRETVKVTGSDHLALSFRVVAQST